MFGDFFKKLFGCGDAADGKKSAASSACCAKKTSGKEVTLKDLEGFVDYVVRTLVDYPDEVKVNSESAENGKVIRIACRKEDAGKIIGKKGKTIIALRTLIGGAANRLQERISVEVVD